MDHLDRLAKALKLVDTKSVDAIQFFDCCEASVLQRVRDTEQALHKGGRNGQLDTLALLQAELNALKEEAETVKRQHHNVCEMIYHTIRDTHNADAVEPQERVDAPGVQPIRVVRCGCGVNLNDVQ
eukprot:373841-Rhodomonas_salina.2